MNQYDLDPTFTPAILETLAEIGKNQTGQESSREEVTCTSDIYFIISGEKIFILSPEDFLFIMIING